MNYNTISKSVGYFHGMYFYNKKTKKKFNFGNNI